jgi:hypothetical protein
VAEVAAQQAISERPSSSKARANGVGSAARACSSTSMASSQRPRACSARARWLAIDEPM